MRPLAIAAVFAAALIPGSAAAQCLSKNPLDCAKLDWQNPKLLNSQWLDTLDTWTAGADWKDTEDCAKVRNAAKQVIRFGNPGWEGGRPKGVNERWPVIEEIFFGDPRHPPRPPAKVYGAHYWDEDHGIWVPMEHTPDDVPDSVLVPEHVMVFNWNLRGQPDTLFKTFQHEVAHHAGWGKKYEKKVDTLETCGIRNVQREDTIWKEKEDQTEHDPPPIDTLMIEMGGETSQHCYLCTFERRISNCRDIGNDTWCDVKWHMIDCE